MSTLIGLDTLAERWSRVRALLRDEGVGPVVVYAMGVLGHYGLAHYLTGTFPDRKGTYIVFGNESPPVIVAGSPQEDLRWRLYGRGTVEIAYPSGASRIAQLRRVAELVNTQQDSKPPAVAAGGMRGLPRKDHQRLTKLLGISNLPDVSHLLAQAKRLKTPTDLEGMRSSVKMAEDALDGLIARAYVGMTEREAAAMIESKLRADGAPTSLVDVSGGPYLSQAPTDRLLQDGDLVTVFVEVANPDGYWAEIGALVAFGTLASSQRTLAERTIATLQDAEMLLTPGTRASDLARGIDRLLEAGCHPAFGYGHGVGIDEEQPAVSPDDHTVLESGMSLALHPSISIPGGQQSVAVANTYSVGDHGVVPLSEYPYSIPSIT